MEITYSDQHQIIAPSFEKSEYQKPQRIGEQHVRWVLRMYWGLNCGFDAFFEGKILGSHEKVFEKFNG